MNFKQDVFRDIVKNKKKVIVVGGSKSACDLALCFIRAGYDNFVWLCRKPYIFWKFEVLFCHNRTIGQRLLGLTTIFGLLLSLVSEKIGAFIFWANGCAVTIGNLGKPHNDLKKFKFGVLCPKQRRDLATVPKERIFQSSIVKYTENGLQITGNTIIPADVILFGTGGQTGINMITYKKDGKDYDFDPLTKMLDHFTIPDFPIFSNSTELYTTFGPVRAVNSAEMAVFQHCVRPPMTEDEMKALASRQIGGDMNSVSGWVFQSQTSFVKIFLTMHMDLLLRGHVNTLDLLWHVYEIFCISKHTALKMNNLPASNNLLFDEDNKV